MFYNALEKEGAFSRDPRSKINRAIGHMANAVITNPYAITGAVGGGVGGAIAAGEDNRTKGALGGAVLGGLAGKGIQEGIARFGRQNPPNIVFSDDDVVNVPGYLRELRRHTKEHIKAEGAPADEVRAYMSAFPDVLTQTALTEPKTTAAVLGAGAATGAGAGTLLRKRKEKRKRQEKRAMFYDVLMEKKAQQAEERQQPRLSRGQRAGVGAAGITGAAGGVGVLGVAALTNKPFGTFLEQGTKKERAAHEAAVNQYKSVLDRMNSFEDISLDGTAQDIKELLKNKDLPQGSSEALNKVLDARAQMDSMSGLSFDQRQKIRQADSAARRAFSDTLNKRKDEAAAVLGKINKNLDNRRLLRNQLILGGTALGGGLAAGYGAKKLFDRYNRRKQQRS